MRAKQWIALGIILLLMLFSAGCGNGEEESSASESEPDISEVEVDPEYPLFIRDATISSRPGKIVSLTPSITEKIVDLGFQSRLVGISDYCDYPEEIMGLPRCGTAQLPALDMLESLRPHLLLTESPLSDDIMSELEGAGIQVVLLPHATSFAQLADNYISLACIMEGRSTGDEIGRLFVRNLELSIDRLIPPPIEDAEGDESEDEEADEDAVTGKPALYLRMLDFTVATGDTLEGELMERLGFYNIAGGYTDWTYPPEDAKSEEGVAAFRSVEMIFMDERDVTIKMLEQSSYYKSLPATLKDKFLYIDCTVFERQSLRMLDTLSQMAEMLSEPAP